MNPNSDKPKLTRPGLESHFIFYYENVYSPDHHNKAFSIPEHVNRLRKLLLYFDSIRIGEDSKKDIEEHETELKEFIKKQMYDIVDLDLFVPDRAYFDKKKFVRLQDDEEEGKKKVVEIENAKRQAGKHARSSQNLHKGMEAGWMNFLRSNFFTNFECSHKVQEENLCKHTDEYALEENQQWKCPKKFQCPSLGEGSAKLIDPKPDLTFGFKAQESQTTRFSIDNLGKLQDQKPAIYSTLTPKLLKYFQGKPIKLMNSDTLCFPWAVVEAKHAQVYEKDAEYSYCQLANATACAFKLRENLVKSVHDTNIIDPIIGFTCVGPVVRLWLTYRNIDDIYMVCIWATSVDSIWGALALTQVVKNMHLWASRDLQPRTKKTVEFALEKLKVLDITRTPQSTADSGVDMLTSENLFTPTRVPRNGISGVASNGTTNSYTIQAWFNGHSPDQNNPELLRSLMDRISRSDDSTENSSSTGSPRSMAQLNQRRRASGRVLRSRSAHKKSLKQLEELLYGVWNLLVALVTWLLPSSKEVKSNYCSVKEKEIQVPGAWGTE